VQAEEARALARNFLRDVAAASRPLTVEQQQQLQRIDDQLRACLSDVDPFWIRWSQFREQQAGQA
jgi:hypothetical protein